MAEEYGHGSGICGGGGGNWWDSPRASTVTRFDCSSSTSSASASYGWITETGDNISTRSTVDSASATSGSASFHDGHLLQGANSANTSAVLIDPTFQIMGLRLPSQAIEWNHSLLRDEKAAESSFRAMIQEGMATSSNFNQETGGLFESHQDHCKTLEKLFPRIKIEDAIEFKQINRGLISLDHQPMENHFQLESPPVYSSPSSNLQALIGSVHHHRQQQLSPFGNRPMSFGYDQQQLSYGLASDVSLLPSWSKAHRSHRSSPPKQMPAPPHSAPFGPASVAAGAMSDTARPSFFPSLQPQFPMPSFDEKPKQRAMEVKEALKKSSGDQTTNKRPRNNEASSTLPPFKVRKEKMGDRITALQQLVSPFGKTDTASVLSEAIEYIKFLHEQVNVLSTPYLKSGASLHRHQNSNQSKNAEGGAKQDLRSRGLCLVPVSSTFPVAHEPTVEFWTPTFGGTFR
ncbi:hypothetical protein Nepgr_026811 [Nepenthes gracilis]|uniref:BHLH domain-containing protein n=1 Tax=Nepenthes gracilis TaxID=150966 RepID=A0AAD3T993_NEPGR|nr:hypothetical protein Nepgr_026811 [Nepenthes gracilis]